MLTTLWRTVQPRYKQVTLVPKTWRWGVECRLYIDFRSIFVINCDNIGLGGLKSIINYMEGWWGKAVGGCVRLLSTTLNMIQNVSLPPAWLVNHPHNQTYLSHMGSLATTDVSFINFLLYVMLRIQLMCVSVSGNARWKERKWRANRKYPDYRNKWENILCGDPSLSPSRGDDTGICPPCDIIQTRPDWIIFTNESPSPPSIPPPQ